MPQVMLTIKMHHRPDQVFIGTFHLSTVIASVNEEHFPQIAGLATSRIFNTAVIV